MTTIATLKDRYAEVRERIARAASRAGTDADRVLLVAVTKHAEPDQIRELIRLGHTDFGENRVLQLVQRAAIIDEWLHRHRTTPGVIPPSNRDAPAQGSEGEWQCPAMPGTVRWHMIGHLQRNKARKAVEVCRLIHTVDSLRLAEELQLIGARREKPIDILVQVNCSGERQKSGCAIAAAPHLVAEIETMVQLRVRGLMTMAPLSANPEDSRPTFGRCRELFDEIRESGDVPPTFNILSMGMSGDFEIAIQEGANMVRVGTALFGEPRAGADVEDESDDE
ncbi:MAG: YggS family pyridoxal phosphate-dependent enzyme [Phycisphaeraceae bacterium]|nr:YggS family pyridoxal phosphate-dependent enzyme [Phycisphaeraceae bacterium]MBX3405800.1 YggS family pyridoxal phosphate-dependent enzyme [Phycisphaeraceae bacterium]